MNNDFIQEHTRTRWNLRLSYYFSINDDEIFLSAQENRSETEFVYLSFLVINHLCIKNIFCCILRFVLQPLVILNCSDDTLNPLLITIYFMLYLCSGEKRNSAQVQQWKKYLRSCRVKNYAIFFSILWMISGTFSQECRVDMEVTVENQSPGPSRGNRISAGWCGTLNF